MIVENIENNLIWRVKEVTNVYGSTTIYQKTIFYSLYIVFKSCVKVLLAGNRDEGVKHVVTFKEVLQDLGGGHRVHVGVYQHQHALRRDHVEKLCFDITNIHGVY